MEEKEIIYPCELFLKSVYRNTAGIESIIKETLEDAVENYRMESKPSANGKFISFTLAATFESGDHLDSTCVLLKQIDGFMMLI